MSISRIKEIFKNDYKPEKYKEFISFLFPDRAFFITPQEKKDSTLAKHANVESIKELGDITLDDKSRILFYEVELKDGKTVARNRVELRNLIHTDVIPGDIDGILASYYNPKVKDWRLTFISKSLYWDDNMNEIKAETHPKRYTYVLGEKESVKTALKQFEWLTNQIKSREISIDDLIKTFSVEKISNEFFEGYRHQFQTFEAYIADNQSALEYFKKYVPSNIPSEEQQKEAERLIRNFVKKLLGRIVFLYFLQKKGWLGVPLNKTWGDGEPDFMANLFNNFRDKPNFYAKCLVPLFFDTLNRQRTNDIFSTTNSKVPYLNGGLFDKDRIEPTEIVFDPNLFYDLFEFFDQYNFTIDENSPDDFDIGIDPEMLGLLFENLLEDNRLKGTFYTPKEVVHFMCKESLSLYIADELKEKTTPNELREIDVYVKQTGKVDLDVIQKLAQDIDTAISKVKICDPAIGSGAFPMGMVYEILRIKKGLFGLLNRTRFDYREEKISIIRNSIYGVDIDKGAVDIARLRFWLSLIVDEEEPAPLPNLDYKIMQGDSLRESFENIPLDNTQFDHKVTVYGATQLTLMGDGFDKVQKEIEWTTNEREELKNWVDQYFKEDVREAKEALHAKIDRKVLEHISRNVELKQNNVARLRSELEKKYAEKGVNIAKQSKGKDYNYWVKLCDELKDIDKSKQKIRELEQSTERPYFLWNLYFADVLAEEKKGFDIVIGNPPYGVKLSEEIRDFYGLGSKDSYGVFMAMALKKLLKKNGILSFIVSDTWLTIGTHYKLREQILGKELRKVIRLHQDCFKATVNSCIFTLKKSPANAVGNLKVIAADLTNISTRKEVPEFRDKLFHLEQYVGDYTPKYAVYTYPQSLLNTNSNRPIIVGSPKLFALMNDTTCRKEIREIANGDVTTKVEVRKIPLNENEIELVRFGDIADVKVGLQTGDNDYYLYQNPNVRGGYKDINLYRQFLLTDTDLERIRTNEEIRLKVIERGIHKTTSEPNFDPNCYFEGRYIMPHDKGGESDTDEGWLPNFFVITDFFLDWSCQSVKRMKELTIGVRDNNDREEICAYIRNPQYYFIFGITFSTAGIYAPTFRLGSGTIFGHRGSTIFLNKFDVYSTLAILCSKLFKFILKNYENHSVASEAGSFPNLIIPFSEESRLASLSNQIITKQREINHYNFLINEQKEIDRLVYELYGLNEEDINEVETWFARRYPKLASYAYFKTQAELYLPKAHEPLQGKVLALIGAGEGRTVEFKSSLRYCLREKSPQRYIEHSSFKNLAAFLNSEGGTLLIGVEDNGNIIGLENTDFLTFKGDNPKDEFLKHFDNLVERYFGNGLVGNFEVDFATIGAKTLAIVNVKSRSTEPVILKESGKEEFYIRRNASTKALTMFEFFTYAREHWRD